MPDSIATDPNDVRSPKTDRELLLIISQDVKNMEKSVCAKCSQIDAQEKRIARLELHDYAEMAIAGVGVVVVGWAIAAGFIHA